MNKKLVLLLALVGMLGSMFATAQAEEEVPPHAHLFVTGLELDESGEWPVGWKKCRPLANGREVPLQAHHANLHTGRAGEAQWEAGNAVVPIFPGHTPWHDCDSLHAFFFGSGE